MGGYWSTHWLPLGLLLRAAACCWLQILSQLKFTGESPNVGYLVLSPRTGEILAFGGSREVDELGKKCVVASRHACMRNYRW